MASRHLASNAMRYTPSHYNTQHPHSGARAARLHHNHLTHPCSDTGRLLSSTPAIDWYHIDLDWTIIRVRYAADGAPKNAGPRPFSGPTPLNGLGRGVFFGFPCPSPRSGPRPTHAPDGYPLKIGGNKRGPVQGMSLGGPETGARRGLPEKYPPRLRARAGPDE